jgi:hypothetical protein
LIGNKFIGFAMKDENGAFDIFDVVDIIIGLFSEDVPDFACHLFGETLDVSKGTDEDQSLGRDFLNQLKGNSCANRPTHDDYFLVIKV